MEKMVQVAVYLTKSEVKKLENIANEMNYAKSKLIRVMVKCFLDSDDPVKEIFERCFFKK